MGDVLQAPNCPPQPACGAVRPAPAKRAASEESSEEGSRMLPPQKYPGSTSCSVSSYSSGTPSGRSTPLGARERGTRRRRLPPGRMPRRASSTPSQTTLWKGRWPSLKASFLSVDVSYKTLPPIETFASTPTTFPGLGVSPEPRSSSAYCRPEGVVTSFPSPSCGPVSSSAFTISRPSVAASSATTARPPARPKRRDTKPVAEAIGSTSPTLKPAPPPAPCLSATCLRS
mmetsp:Transcript_50459/g.162377  ORF Transcript_50459/g.162377 Transcript_50459/m.162377 type:complete len:229 (+) Transcript_50459:224-910(+)